MSDNNDLLTQIIQEEEQYKDASPDYVAQDLYGRLGKKYNIPEDVFYKNVLGYDAPGFGAEFSKSLKRSMAEIKTLGTDGALAAGYSGLDKLLAAVGVETDLEEKAVDHAVDAYRELESLEKKYPRSVETRHEVDNLDSLMQYLGGLSGQGLGSSAQLIPSALMGGVAAAGSSAVMKSGLQKVAKDGFKRAARKMGKEVADDLVEQQIKSGVLGKAFVRGMGAGAFVGSTAAETGSSYLDMLRDEKDAPGVAIAAGSLKGALEILPEFGVVSRLFKSPAAKDALADATAKQIMQRFGLNVTKEVGKVGSAEAITEATQQAIDIAASDFVNERASTLFTPQGVDSLIEAGIAGFVGAGPLGVLSGGAQTLKQTATKPDYRFDQETFIEEEVDPTNFVEKSDKPPTYEEAKAEFMAAAKPVPPDLSDIDQQERVRSLIKQRLKRTEFLEQQYPALAAQIRKDNLNTVFNKTDLSQRYEGLSFADIKSFPQIETFKPLDLENAKQGELVFKGEQPSLPDVKMQKLVMAPDFFANLSLDEQIAELSDLYDSLGGVDLETARRANARYVETLEAIKRAEQGNGFAPIFTQAELNAINSKVNTKVRKYGPENWSITDLDSPRKRGKLQERPGPIQDPEFVNKVLSAPDISPEIKAKAKAVKDFLTGNLPADPNISQQKLGIDYNRIENTDPSLYETAVENLRVVKVKNPDTFKTDLKQLQKTIRNVVGEQASIDFYDSLYNVVDNNVVEPIRGAQWSNIIAVSIKLNENMGLSNQETGLHEAFHYVYNNTLTEADKKTIQNSKDDIVKYLRKSTGQVPYDLDMFDVEELAATAFGIWADNYVNKKGDTNLLNRVYKKILNLLRSIRDHFRKQGVKSFEDLFQDVAEGKRAKQAVDNIVDDQRLARLQKVVMNAQNRAAEKLTTPQHTVITAKDLEDQLGRVPKEEMLEWTRMQNYVSNYLNTSPGLAAKDPVWAVVHNIMYSQMKNLGILDSYVIEQMHELFQNRQRMINASGILDHLDTTKQELKDDDSGKLLYEKNGKIVRLDQQTSDDVKSLHHGFQTVLKMWRDTTLEKLKSIEGFDTIDEAISHQENIIANADGVQKPSQIERAKQRLKELKDTKGLLNVIKKKLDSNEIYFPRMALGKYGVVIKKKDSKDKLKQGFAIIGEDINGRVNKKELQEVKRRWAEELGYSGDDYTISEPFKLTKNRLINALDGDQNINLEILGSLMASANPKLLDEIQQAIEELGGDVSSLKMDKHFLERNDMLLHSKDYSAVVPAYFSTATRAVNRYRYAEVNRAISEMIDRGFIHTPEGNVTLDQEQQKLYKDLHDYMTKSSTDMAGLRMFNFFWAMGGNISSGLLQLVTLNTFVVGIMNTYGGNPISNNAIVLKNLSKVAGMMASVRFDITKFGDENFLKKHFKDPETIKAVKMAYDRGEFRPSRADDMLGTRSFTSGKVGTSGFMHPVGEKAKEILAFPVQAAEETSRVTAFLSLYETLKKPGALEKFEKNFTAGNVRYSAYKEFNKELPKEVYASLFSIDETHGMYGRISRGKNQQGVFGSLVFPFMQHPMMMFGLLTRMVRTGAASRQGATYIIAATMLMAGLYGIPGWELWKETYQLYFKQTYGREVDLHHELKKALVTQYGFTPKWAEGVTEGFLKPVAGLDISRRISVPFFFQDAIIPMMQGRDNIDQFAGVAGSQVRNLQNNWNRMMSGEANVPSILMDTFAPISVRNMIKAAAVYPEEGLRTTAGTQIMSADQLKPQQLMAKFMGFQPSQISREYEKRNVERLGATGWRYGYDRIINNIARQTTKRQKALNEGKSTEDFDAEIKNLYKELAEFALEANRRPDRDFWNGVRKSVNNRVQNAFYPDVPIREQKGIDYGLLELLYEE